MALLRIPSKLSYPVLPFDRRNLKSTPSAIFFDRNRSTIAPSVLKTAPLTSNYTALPSSALFRSQSLSFLNSNPRSRTKTGVARVGKRNGLKNTESSQERSKRIVIYAFVSFAVGSCIVFAVLKHAPLPSVNGYREIASNAREWIVSRIGLDDRTWWIIYDRAETAFDWFKSIFGTIMLSWAQLIPLIWMHHRSTGSGFAEPARKRRPAIQKVSFDDVEGVGPAKEELLEIVSCLRGSINYDKLGAEPPRGTLLVGPPGTGKTLLARAVAGEAGVPFFSASASEFVEVYVGRGAARIRNLFKDARKHEPSIVFIDELDAVGGKRGRSLSGEHDQTLVQLLTEMDGFETGSKVVVIAATNRPESLDPALCRPGRFSRKVLVGRPNLNGRKHFLAVHLRGVGLEDDDQEICNLVAALTPGLVGADLANIVKEGVLLAAQRGGDAVSKQDILAAVERTKVGIDGQQTDGADRDDFQGNSGFESLAGAYC